MIIKKVKTDNNKYLARVTSYTYDSFRCSLYKMYWVLPIKIHEKIFLRGATNSASEMIESTVFDYEERSLVK